MEDITEIFILIILLATAIAAIKINYSIYQLRKCETYCKIIYNYNGKTQKQIYEILKLEVNHEFPNREIENFSKPYFMADGSAHYVIYLKKLEA